MTAFPNTASVSPSITAEPPGRDTGGRMSTGQGNHALRSESDGHQEPAAARASETVEVPAGDVMALPILPTGFVENTAEVYREVASFDIVPAEKLREYWRVYTITHKKLYDPTANRLENFWWHVWGSKTRNLSGRTLARLYREISTGPTFVPLRTPATRYDGPTIPNFAPPLVPHELSPGSTKADTGAPQANDGNNGADEDTEPETRRQVPASSSRPAPAQSILRKPRPSITGSRPTPRFDLPSSGNQGADGTDDGLVENDSSVGAEGSSSVVSRSNDATTKPSQAVNGNKAAAPKQDSRKSAKPKPAKKKFVVSASSASKKRPLIARRSTYHSSQGSHSSVGSEGTSSRGAATPQSLRRFEESHVMEEDEADADPLEIGDMAASRQANQQSPQPYQQSVSHTRTYRNSPLSDRAAGKQPVRPSYSSQMERTLSQTSESTAVSSVSGLTVASVATGALPDAAARSPSFPPARLESSPAQVSSNMLSSILDTPVASRDKPAARQPSPSSGPVIRPVGGLVRQSTMPYDRGSVQRQQIIRGGSATSLAPMRSSVGSHPPHFAYMSQGSTAAPPAPTSPAPFTAPLMGRSISQDSYGSRPPPLRQNFSSPRLGPMRSTTIAAPSMIAVSGQFMDPVGPDTFSFYSQTGLDDKEDEEEDDGQELSSSFKGESSFGFGSSSSSFQDSQITQRPLFTPTRPTQTPRIPFARTRSQLNVILDREKERLGKGNYNSWNESRGGRDHDTQRRGT